MPRTRFILLRTVDRDPERLAARHQEEINRIARLATPRATSLFNLDASEAYRWSLYHLLQNEKVIKEELFSDYVLSCRRS